MTPAEELELLRLRQRRAQAQAAAEPTPAPAQPEESLLDAVKRNATGFVRGAEQGGTLGLADELGAYGQGVLDLALRTQPKMLTDALGVETRYREPFALKQALANYRQARGENREEYRKAEEAAPEANLIGQIAGGFALPIPGGAGQSLGRAALQGAATGAALGAGSGEADLTKGEFGKFGTEVALGAGLGGAFGAGGHVLGKALSAGGEKLRDFAGKRLAGVLQRNSDDAAREASKVTNSARAEAGHAAQDAYRQLEHLRELGRQGQLSPEQQAVFRQLSEELGDKATEKLIPAANRKADAAAAFQEALASEPQRAADRAAEKLSLNELKGQVGARFKRYALPAIGGYAGSQVADELGLGSGLGAGAGALMGAGLRPMMHSLLRMSRQPAVQSRLLSALGGAGAAGQWLAPAAEGATNLVGRLAIPEILEGLSEEERARLYSEALRASP